jgi:adhesin/invasin
MTVSAPQTVTVQANPSEIVAGGGAFGTSNITATAKDQFNQNVADGTFVHFTTTLGSIAPFQFVESSDSVVTKTGAFANPQAIPQASGGDIRYSNSAGDKVAFTFTGVAISLIHNTQNNAGIANVRIDGGAVYSGTLDTYSATQIWQVETPIATNLNPGAHTIEAEVSGNKNTASSDTYVYVDAFRVGTQTSGGKAYATLTSGTVTGTAVITATAIGSTAVGTTTVTIIPNVAYTDNSSVSASPSSIVANGTMTSTLAALARNKLGGSVQGAIVGFTSDKGTNSKPAYKYAEAETDPSVSWSGGWVATGTAICPSPFLSGTTGVATYIFQASAVSVVYPKSPGTNLLNVYIDGLLAKTIDQGDVTTNTCGFKTLITDTLDPNITHFLTATVASGSAFIDAFESGAATDSNGQATGVLTAGTVTGRATITATISQCGPVYGGTVLVTNTIYLGEPAATIDLTASPSSIRADGVDASLLKAIVRDEFNNPTSGQLVTFTTSLGILDSSTKTTAPDGEATASLKGTQVGTAYITATAKSPTGSIISDSTTVIFVSGPPVIVTLSPSQLNITCCVTSTITATLQDQLNNPVNDGTPVTFASSLTPSVTFVDPNPVLTVNGVATMTVHGQVAGTAGTITGTTIGGIFGTTGITVATSLPTQLSLEKSKDTIKVGSGPQSRAIITATVADACNNLLPGIPVTFTLTTGQGSFDPGTQITQVVKTTSNGVVTQILYGWNIPGTAVISVTTGYVTNTVSIIIVGSAANMNLQASPPTIPVGYNTSTLTATVKDALNQPVFDGTVVTFATSLGSVAPPIQPTTGGVATTTLTSDVIAGTAIVTATADTVSATIPVTFTPLSAFTVTVTAAPTSIVVGGSKATVTATVTDQYGNNVANNTAVTFTTSMGSIVEAQPRLTSNGAATTTLLSGNFAGTAVVIALVDSHTGNTNVQFLPAAPFTVTVTASPTSIPVSTGTSAITAAVTDQYGNSVLNGTVVTFTASLGGAFSPPTRTTTSGVATSTLTAGPTAGTATVTATAGTAFGTTPVTFTAGVPVTVTLVASPTTTVVGTSAALTATVWDQFNNLIGGAVVTFTASPGSTAPPTNTTSAAGMATSTVTSNIIGPTVVTATADSRVGTAIVTFTAGLPFTVTMVAVPPSIPIGGSTSTVTATVVDKYGNRVADGTVVSFTTSLGTIAPLIQPTTGGVAISTLTSGNTAGTAMVTATAGIAVGTLPVTFTAGPPFTVTVAAFPTSTVVGAPIVITAAVQDQSANPVPDGTVVTFATSLGTIAPPTGTTTGGTVAATLSSNVAGTAIVTATAGARWGTTIVTFTPGVSFTITVLASPLVIPIGGYTSTVTATVRDQYGNLVSDGTRIDFSTSLGSVSPLFAGTLNGVVTTILTSGNIIGTARVHAYSGVASGFVDVTFTVGLPRTVIVVAQPPSIPVATGTSVISATVLDIGNNPVANGTLVTFATSMGNIIPIVTTTNNGIAQATLSASTVAGTAVVTATAGTVSGTTTVVFMPGPPANMTLVVFPTSIPIGGATAVITATVQDLYGNCVADGTGVSFATTLGTFQQSGTTTYNTVTTRCIATATLVSGLSTGTAQVSAVAGGVLHVVNVNFTIGPPYSVTVTASPPSISIVTGSSTVTATVRDAGNNLVADGVVVNFATSLGTINPPTALTTNGIATTTLTAGTRTGTAIVTATVGTIWATTNVTFTTPYPPQNVVVTAYPLQIPADGVSTSTITATVTEIYGNPVADGNVANFFVTSGAMIAPLSAPTAGGIVTATLTAGTTPTTVTVRVIVGSRLGEANVVLYLPPRYKLYLPVLYKNFSGGW